jgi:hypothetical protein
MCFSAIASFTAAAITGGIGVATLRNVGKRSELPLAAVPLLFAVQQVIEGSLWLSLDGGPAALSRALTLGFLLLAQVWWPIFVPIAVLCVEPDRLRRGLILFLLGLGVVVGLFLLWQILAHEHRAAIIDEHLVYGSDRSYPLVIGAGYLAAAVLPPLLSSHPAVRVLAVVVLIGAIIAYIAYWQAFVSVWCFFAAAASGIILFHFERQRRDRPSGLRASH